MGTEKRWVLLSVLLSFLLAQFLNSCGSFLSTPIRKILDNPRDYSGKPVVISGEVVEIFSLLVIKYFVVRDKTGEITVITDRPLPKKGAAVTVKGTVQEAFSLGDRQVMVIVEEKGP